MSNQKVSIFLRKYQHFSTKFLKYIGFEVCHTAIEFDDIEYYYCSNKPNLICESEPFSFYDNVDKSKAKNSKIITTEEGIIKTVEIGKIARNQFYLKLEEVKEKFYNKVYSKLFNNCNHFTNELLTSIAPVLATDNSIKSLYIKNEKTIEDTIKITIGTLENFDEIESIVNKKEQKKNSKVKFSSSLKNILDLDDLNFETPNRNFIKLKSTLNENYIRNKNCEYRTVFKKDIDGSRKSLHTDFENLNDSNDNSILNSTIDSTTQYMSRKNSQKISLFF